MAWSLYAAYVSVIGVIPLIAGGCLQQTKGEEGPCRFRDRGSLFDNNSDYFWVIHRPVAGFPENPAKS
jgi:hypothetical protein